MFREWFALRFSAFYAAVFLTLGVYLPFWPVWLSGRGLDAAEVGLLIAVTSWVKVAGIPAVARLADHWGRPARAIALCAGLAAAAFATFFATNGFASMLLVQILAALFFQALVPLGESHAMRGVLSAGLDYGRVRLWGSLSFIAGTLLAGTLIKQHPVDAILWLLLTTLLLTLLSALALPRLALPTPSPPRRSREAWRRLAGRRFLLLLGAAGLLQSSHAVYYGFSAIAWSAGGLSGPTVAWLWAVGVLAEILLFSVGDRAVARWGAGRLLAVAALAGTARWCLLAIVPGLPVLVLAQTLHGLTFGAAHLAAVHFIGRHAPGGLSATAQGLYSAVSGGLMMGLAALAAGHLYRVFESGAYVAMAALCLLALPLSIILRREESVTGCPT